MEVKQEIMGMHPQRKPVQVGPLFSDISDISDQSDLEDEHNTTSGCKDPAGICLFCLFPSKDLDDNVEHMCRVHGFFLPDSEYLVDQRGLISYLADKIEHDYLCLYCNGRGKEYKNPQAVRAHMVSIQCIWITNICWYFTPRLTRVIAKWHMMIVRILQSFCTFMTLNLYKKPPIQPFHQVTSLFFRVDIV